MCEHCTDPNCGLWSPDCEHHPRNATAIRTAIMLGAEYQQDNRGLWTIRGVSMSSVNKTMPAWMYLLIFGLGVDKDAKPCQIVNMEPDKGRFEAWRRIGEVVSPKGIKDADV